MLTIICGILQLKLHYQVKTNQVVVSKHNWIPLNAFQSRVLEIASVPLPLHQLPLDALQPGFLKEYISI